ncbi:MAG TPA: hypothetical protein VN224_06320 [Xanthomonadales bacterium]|nr:hypothetical protein [Xanthomonadales bacterium]
MKRRSVNDIVGDAIREYIESHPTSREDVLEMVRAIVKGNASLLDALANAYGDNDP